MPPPGSYSSPSRKSPTRSRNNKQKARRATAAKATPKAKQPNQNNNQRANLPSEQNRYVAPVAKVAAPVAKVTPSRPAMPIVSTAKATAAPQANIIQTQGGVLRDGLAPATSVVNSYSQGDGQMSPALAAKQKKVNSVVASTKNSDNVLGINSTESANKQSKSLLSLETTNLPARNYGAFDMDTYKSVAKTNEDSIIPSVLLSAIKNDKYRNDEVSYNQAYWAGLRSGNTSQADMKAKQDAIGMKKSYSGDRVITPDMQRQASDDLSRLTGSMATLGDGVTKTVGDKYGFFNERQDTTFKYEDGTSIVQKGYDPSLFGINFGAKTSTTYVDGVEVQTKSGRDPLGRDAKITKPDGLARGINDRVEAGPDAAKELSNIDNQIKTETDPAKLRALHKRRLMLMRMNRTNTKFAGLLGEADTKRTNLMSIS
tara:strand:- start:153 stop:1436 length:1284 start_codon:yes stop_codon:yes gene_type:complete